jgi:CHAT domain-containing protein
MFLPLHAAGIYDGIDAECCADYVVCSYTPTLTALLRAQTSNPSFHRRDVRLGLIAAMQAWDVSLPTLPNVEEEISNVKAAAERASISVDDSGHCVGHEAIVTRVTEVFRSTNIVHIACHGKQNTGNALSSGFCLSDESFSISRLMDLELKDAFFAFLSACETAKGDEKQPDQTVHLAAAMLFVGFRSAVATMWLVLSLHRIQDGHQADLFQGNGGRRRTSSREAILRETFRGG